MSTDHSDSRPPTLTTWKIDPPHSHVEFAVRHLMISTVKGRFGDVEGTVVTDEADPARARSTSRSTSTASTRARRSATRT